MARGLDPFVPPDWRYAHGNRSDDPDDEDATPIEARFRVLYCASERVCAFGETIARFRPNLRALAGIEAVEEDDAFPAPAHSLSLGVVTEDWRLKRRIGTIRLDPALRFADLTDAATLSALRPYFAAQAVALGFPDPDLSTVTSNRTRALTQRIARYVYEQTTDDGQPVFAGICDTSRLDARWTCWAIFADRLHGQRGPAESIFPDDPGLREAANIFGLAIESLNGTLILPE